MGVIPPIVPCVRGLHASQHVLDTLRYRWEGRLTLVELSGEIASESDKYAAEYRKTLAILDLPRQEQVFRDIACDGVEILLRHERNQVTRINNQLPYGASADEDALSLLSEAFKFVQAVRTGEALHILSDKYRIHSPYGDIARMASYQTSARACFNVCDRFFSQFNIARTVDGPSIAEFHARADHRIAEAFDAYDEAFDVRDAHLTPESTAP